MNETTNACAIIEFSENPPLPSVEGDKRGNVGVQIHGAKHLVNHKRLESYISTAELYPDDYDFSIVFDSVENRKIRHKMDKRHTHGTIEL